uniref:16S rRNA (cytosine(967)-C(5))-methyltransferase n=1 Tax=Paulinella chromatophora TaxID=39717 RepID=B1X3K7_PAUCH|nr:Sun protein (Fmu protein) [Paulinella chromatophora]ACB42526.1 Sun protein (Fmu protein) [Paulinella chromatophora]
MKSTQSVHSRITYLDSPSAGLDSRMVAWQILQSVAAGAYASVALEKALQRHPLPPVDRGLATEIAYGSIRRRLTLDTYLSHLGKVLANKQPPLLRWLLHVGLYQLLFVERVPSAAAINTTVELAKKSSLATLAPVVNGILRTAHRFQQSGKAFVTLSNSSNNLEAIHSLPNWLTNNLLSWRGQMGLEAFAVTSNDSPPIDLRINPLNTSRAQVLHALIKLGIKAQPLPGLSQGIAILGRLGNLQILPGFKLGHWCIQDRAAQWISPLLDPHPGHRVLDVCSAPGGKSTHIAELMGDVGEIWALDSSKVRLQKVVLNAKRLGLQTIHTLVADGITISDLKPEWKGTFDRILIDAPCSGLGTLVRHSDARWRITFNDIKELERIQERLLKGIIPLLKPGGKLVYATCTINPNENETQITKLLNSSSNYSCIFQQTRWPSSAYGNGFFAAVLET